MTVLKSPVIPDQNEGHCLSFWYWIHGKGVTLTVDKTESDMAEIMWERTLDEGLGWQWAQIVANANDDFHYKFRLSKSSVVGTILLDDIWYSPSACVSSTLDFTDTCNFETGLCGLSNVSTLSGMKWKRYAGLLPAERKAPSGDNTYRTDFGHYLLFDQSSDSSSFGGTAIIESQVFTAPDNEHSGGQTCLRFHYFLSGSEVGSLGVVMVLPDQSIDDVGWRATGDHGNMWLAGQIELNVPGATDFKIEFEAIAGNGSNGTIGLDDLILRPGICEIEGACGFENKDLCTWSKHVDVVESSWFVITYDKKESYLAFMPEEDTDAKGTLVSTAFEANRVQCMHFVWAYASAGNGSLALSIVPGQDETEKQLLWYMPLDAEGSIDAYYPEQEEWKPARVTVESTQLYQIYLAAETTTTDQRIFVDNIMFTSQPCLAVPDKAVPVECDFSDGLCSWYQDLSDDADFVTATVKTEPKTFIRMVSVFDKPQAVARLYSPRIPAGTRCLTFSYFLFGADLGYLKVFVDTGLKKIPFVSFNGGMDQREWQMAKVDLVFDSNYQIVFEGMCFEGFSCDLGFTDITLSSTSCPDRWQKGSIRPYCNFEAMAHPLCQWTVQTSVSGSTYTWVNAGGIDNQYPEAPKTDYTLGASGHYAYVPPPSNDQAEAFFGTSITSTTIQSLKFKTCLYFAYYMEDSESGTLNVYQESPGNKSQAVIWSTSVSDSVWRKGHIELKEMETFQVIFEAVANEDTSKALAIDEIRLNPCGHSAATNECQFTHGLCFWTNVVDGSDSFDWEREKARDSEESGPTHDHTDKAKEGFFLMASNTFGKQGDKAKLLSEMLFPKENGTGDMCVSFYYFLSGKGSALLKVNMIRGFEKNEERSSLNIWEIVTSRTKTKEWVRGDAPVDSRYTDALLKFEIEATIADGSVAIDDVSIVYQKCETHPSNASPPVLALDEASCTFNDGGLCDWKNQPNSSLQEQWRLQDFDTDHVLRNRNAGYFSVGSYIFTSTELNQYDNTAILESPWISATEGVICLQFWYLVNVGSYSDLSMVLRKGSNSTTIWHADKFFSWQEAAINIHSTERFQIALESKVPQHPNRHAVNNIYFSQDPCVLPDECDFRYTWCEFKQDDQDDFDWIRQSYAVQPDIDGHAEGQVARIKSPLYVGGGPQCLTFTYKSPKDSSGPVTVHIQEVDGTLSDALWSPPKANTLDVSGVRKARVPIDKTKPFQIIFQHTIEKSSGEIPSVDDVKLMQHECEPQGWCDFEEDFCTYNYVTENGKKSWQRFTATEKNPRFNLYPPVDFTLKNSFGSFVGALIAKADNEDEAVATLQSPILSTDSSSCLTFAYATSGGAYLEVAMDVDDEGVTDLYEDSAYHPPGYHVEWKQIQLDIAATKTFTVSFTARSGKGSNAVHSSFALDDIKLWPGFCKDLTTSLPATEYPEPEIIQSLSCDFERTDSPFCSYQQGTQTNAYWRKTHGSWNSSGLGFDHTRGDSKGIYAAMVSITDDESAQATLEVFLDTLSDKTPHCISFWYNMAGNPYNSLSLYLKEDTLLWEKSGEEDLVWKQATVDLDTRKDSNSITDDLDISGFEFRGLLVEKEGHVAIDDIEVYHGSCPISDVCEFEADGLCDFNQDNSDMVHWQRKRAGTIADKSTTNLLNSTDHTYSTPEGHVMYCCSEAAPHISMRSRMYKFNPDGHCLSFWHKRYMQRLKVYTVSPEGMTISLLELPSLIERSWRITRTTIKAQTDFQIVFETLRSDSNENIMLDDIFFQSVFETLRSDGNDNIMLDDILVTDGPCQELYSCDFSHDFCTWTQSSKSNTGWRLTSGLPPPGQDWIGPSKDHTTEMEAGQYLILQGVSDSVSVTADVATLTSQTIYIPSNFQRDLCFSFWYHMSDANAGSLSVKIEGTKKTYGPFNHEADGWMREFVSFVHMGHNTDTKISIIGTVKPGEANYIALDDLDLSDQPCSMIHQDLKYTCRDPLKTKIPYSKICDFVSDCPNDDDEKNCGSCNFEDNWCGFVDESKGTNSWHRIEANSSAAEGPIIDANGHFLNLDPSERAVLMTSKSLRMTSPVCKLQLQAYVPEVGSLTINIKTLHETSKIFDVAPTQAWNNIEAFIGNLNAPFQIQIKGYSSENAIGIDDIQMVDCGFNAAADSCKETEFTCDNKACVPYDNVCDLTHDCRDSSDETNCGQYQLNDFEYDFGIWTTYDGDYDIWKVEKVTDLKFLSGNSRDHTPGLLQGNVASLKHKDKFEEDGLSRGYLVSPVLEAEQTDLDRKCQVKILYSGANKKDPSGLAPPLIGRFSDTRQRVS